MSLLHTPPAGAIFIDAENVPQWLKHDGPETLLQTLPTDMAFRVRKAYADWSSSHLLPFQESLTIQGFDLEHHYHPAKSKNSADIHMAIDIMKYAYTRPDLHCFVIVSADSDFSTVFRALRSLGKQVIGVGYPSVLSRAVASSCQQFIQIQPVKKTVQDKLESRIHKHLKHLGGTCLFSSLKSVLLAEEPDFSERTFGFHSFKALLLSFDSLYCAQDPITQANYVSLVQDEMSLSPENPEQLANLSQRFRQELARKHWYAIDGETLIRVYQYLSQQPISRQRALSLAPDDLGLSSKTVRKAMGILSKAELFVATAERETDSTEPFPQRLWTCQEREDIFPDVDYTLRKHLSGTGLRQLFGSRFYLLAQR